uniref:Uncharacterized protein n=1 Tax=Arundo donax TaxID=35708 RepID=A0A0A9F3H7_ARUDO
MHKGLQGYHRNSIRLCQMPRKIKRRISWLRVCWAVCKKHGAESCTVEILLHAPPPTREKKAKICLFWR